MPNARPIYLDNHATTPVDPRVAEAMWPWFTEKLGNAASVNHAFGWEAAEAVEAARERIAKLINAPARSLVFTSGATEANNLAIKGAAGVSPPGSHLITCAAEHRAVLDPVRRLGRQGHEITIVPCDRFGIVDPQRIADAVRPDTVLVSVMLANNEVGTINPVADIAGVCRKRGVLVHCDAAQAVGKVPVDVNELGVDLLSVSAHKLYGPKGVGVLYVRREGGPRVKLEPQIDGGGHEGHLRSGTLPVPLVVGFGVACDLAGRLMPTESVEHARWRDELQRGLSEQLDGITVNGHPTSRLPNNLNVSVSGVDGEALMMGLKRIAVSSGAACSSADPEPSHVLLAMGMSEPLAKASLRIGLGRFNSAVDFAVAVEEVTEVVTRLRERKSSRPPGEGQGEGDRPAWP
jgi:cysteine desulfurase